MSPRTWPLLRARLEMTRRSGWPIPALVFLASLGAASALLVRDLLPAYPFALAALSVGGLVLTFPLFSDLGALLRHDEAAEWVASLPARASERTLARALHVLALLGSLAAAWFVPWALLAPGTLAPAARLALPLLGFALGVFLTAAWAWIQQLLLARWPGVLLGVETVLVGLVTVALAQILGHLPELAAWTPASPEPLFFPPAWFALPLARSGWSLWLPAAIVVLSLASLLFLSETESRPSRGPERRRSVLRPFLWLAERIWVRSEELGPFDLVSTALPREREVALRTYPMLGIPLAFLWVSVGGGRSPDAAWRSDLLALLLVTAGVYLPLLLTHVPLSESPAASWILRTAPIPARAVTGGAIKALFARWLLPLYVGVLVLGLAFGQAELLVRLWLPAVLLGLLLLRFLYGRCVRDLPLSVAPEALRGDVDWAGVVLPLAVGLTLLAVVANRSLGGTGTLLGIGILAAAEALAEHRQGRSRAPGP